MSNQAGIKILERAKKGMRVVWKDQFRGKLDGAGPRYERGSYFVYILFDNGDGTSVNAGHWIDVTELKFDE